MQTEQVEDATASGMASLRLDSCSIVPGSSVGEVPSGALRPCAPTMLPELPAMSVVGAAAGGGCAAIGPRASLAGSWLVALRMIRCEGMVQGY